MRIHNIRMTYMGHCPFNIIMQGGGRGGYEQRPNYSNYNRDNRGDNTGGNNFTSRDSGRDSGGAGGFRIPAHKMVYDGKRMRKAITRRTVDFNASIIRGILVFFLVFTLLFIYLIFIILFI